MKQEIQQLIEAYERRLTDANEYLKNVEPNECTDIEDWRDMSTKADCYTQIIHDLKSVSQNNAF